MLEDPWIALCEPRRVRQSPLLSPLLPHGFSRYAQLPLADHPRHITTPGPLPSLSPSDVLCGRIPTETQASVVPLGNPRVPARSVPPDWVRVIKASALTRATHVSTPFWFPLTVTSTPARARPKNRPPWFPQVTHAFLCGRALPSGFVPLSLAVRGCHPVPQSLPLRSAIRHRCLS